MKRVFFFFLSVILILLGYFAYDKHLAKDEISPWQFVPSKAALIFEGDKTLELYDSLKRKQVWSAVSGLPALASWENKLKDLDSISESSINEVFANNRIQIAIFPIAANQLDALFIIEISSSEQRNLLFDIKDRWIKQGFRNKERQYNGFQIEEFYRRPNGPMFSMIRKGGYLIGSFTPFLVEDAIRAFNEPESFAFSKDHPDVFKLNPLENDEGNIYLNLKEVGELVKLFTIDKGNSTSGDGFLDLGIHSNYIKLSGFVIPNEGNLKSFNSPPKSFNLLDVIPDNVALLRHYSFGSAATWRDNLKQTDTSIKESSESLTSQYDLNIDFLFRQLGNESAVADLETLGSDKTDRLCFLEVSKLDEVRRFMNLASSRTARDSVFQDQIGEYQIRKIDSEDFPNALLGDLAKLNGDCYYLFYRQYLILSNSIAELKKLIQAIENDNTWRKSMKINQLLDLSSREANYSLIVNVPRFWNQFMQSLDDKWKPFFQSNETGFKSLEHFALQFNLVDDRFFTNLVALQSNPPRQPARIGVSEEAIFPFQLITKPFIHRSHVNQALEILVQDSSYQLYHLDSDLDILWTMRLKGPIVGAIQAVDFYHNGKKQYAFVSGSLLHIVDRTGEEIDGYPKAIPAVDPIEYFSVVDYDGSKNYRFMITDIRGNIYLLNKEGVALEGWKPNENKEKLVAPPEHIRVAGRDAFIFFGKDKIDLKTRRGSSYSGFPIEFDDDLKPAYFTEATGSFSTSKLTAVSQGGEVLRINFSGKIEHRDQLYKPTLDANFELIPDVLNNTFLITRFANDEWEVLDGSGNSLFKKTYLGNQPKDVKFYRFGGDNTLITVTNEENDLITVYDLKGNVLTPSGLSSENPASIIHYENQGFYEFYLSARNRLQKVRIR